LSDPSCPQYGKPSTNPRFNTQHVIEDEDPQAEHHPQDEDGHEFGSQHSNSWGGSQYDPQDEGDNEDELEYQEVIPEGEDDDNASEAEEVRMSSMRTVQIFALRRVTEGNLNAPQPVEHPSDEQTPVESTDDLDPLDEFHRDDPIIDPAYIEYHNGIIYRREPDQTEEQIDSDLQQAAIGATCMVCHQCHPQVHIQYLMGPQYIIIYYTLARHQSNGVWHKNKLETMMRILILNNSSRCVSSKMTRL